MALRDRSTYKVGDDKAGCFRGKSKDAASCNSGVLDVGTLKRTVDKIPDPVGTIDMPIHRSVAAAACGGMLRPEDSHEVEKRSCEGSGRVVILEKIVSARTKSDAHDRGDQYSNNYTVVPSIVLSWRTAQGVYSMRPAKSEAMQEEADPSAKSDYLMRTSSINIIRPATNASLSDDRSSSAMLSRDSCYEPDTAPGNILKYGYADIMLIPKGTAINEFTVPGIECSKYWVAIYDYAVVVADIGSYCGTMSEPYRVSHFNSGHIAVPTRDIKVETFKNTSSKTTHALSGALLVTFPNHRKWLLYPSGGMAGAWLRVIKEQQKRAGTKKRTSELDIERNVTHRFEAKASNQCASCRWRQESDLGTESICDNINRSSTRGPVNSDPSRAINNKVQVIAANSDCELHEHRLKSMFSFFSRSSSTERSREALSSSPGSNASSSSSSVPSRLNERKSASSRSPSHTSIISENGKKPMFGSVLSSQTTQDILVPRIVTLCVNEIEKKGLTTSGIYRVPANMNLLQALRARLANGENVDFNSEDIDVNVTASLLKSYLRDLPDSLIPQSYFKKFVDVLGLHGDKVMIEETKPIVKSLPSANSHTLKYILDHLMKISNNSDKNMMNISNLAIVFGPTILRMPEETENSTVPDYSFQITLMEFLIKNKDAIFNGLKK